MRDFYYNATPRAPPTQEYGEVGLILTEKLHAKRKNRPIFFFAQSLPCDPPAASDCAKTLIVGGSRARGPTVWPSQNGGAAVSLPCVPGDGSGATTASIVANAHIN